MPVSEMKRQVLYYSKTALKWLLFLFSAVLFIHLTWAEAEAFDTSKDNWAVVGGYGQSVPGWGQTSERVETLDIIPRYHHVIFDNMGSGWYRGYHSINGNYQFGLGLRYQDFVVEARYHHISNAGKETPNVPLNSWKLLFGISF